MGNTDMRRSRKLVCVELKNGAAFSVVVEEALATDDHDMFGGVDQGRSRPGRIFPSWF